MGDLVHNQPFDEAHDVDEEEELNSSLARTPEARGLGTMDHDTGDSPPLDQDDSSGSGFSDEYGEDEADLHFAQQGGVQNFGEDLMEKAMGHIADGDGLGPSDESDLDMDEMRAPPPRGQTIEHMSDGSADGGGGVSPSISASSDDGHGSPIDGEYDPAEYDSLPVSSEIKQLFTYIGRYEPQRQELETRLKPFIPDFIPAVGDIDAMMKIPRSDGVDHKLGLEVLDEPCANQSDGTVLDLQLRSHAKATSTSAVKVSSVKDAMKQPRAIEAWINSITDLHRDKPPPTVQYSTPMPEIDSLMREWPPKFEELLKELKLPGADINVTLKEYVSIVCTLLDIPIHNGKRVEALHVLFTLFVVIRTSQFASGIEGLDTAADEPVQAEVLSL